MAGRGTRIPNEERIFNLILALLATRAGLTKAQILASVQGYRELFDDSVHAPSAQEIAALERKFERDKESVRSLGVQLETVDNPASPGNNQELLYRIEDTGYSLPASVSFDAEQWALLDAAARIWQAESLSAPSRRALTKLSSLGVPADGALLGILPKVTAHEPSFETFAAAATKHSAVSFRYAKPGAAEAGLRELVVYAILQFNGAWHVSGFDRSVGAERTFLLSRVVGPVENAQVPSAEERSRVPADPVAELRDGLSRLWSGTLATVRVSSGSDASVRLANRAGTGVDADGYLVLHYTDTAVLAGELAGFGSSVRVISPPDLVDAVTALLTSVVDRHSGPSAVVDGGDESSQNDGSVARRKPTSRRPSAQGVAVEDRVTLLMSLVPYLLQHDAVPVAELASRFGQSPEKIRAAVSTLTVSGVPGDSSYYQPADLFDIDYDLLDQHDEVSLTHHVAISGPPRLSGQEAAALIAGLQYLRGIAGPEQWPTIDRTVAALCEGIDVPAAESVAADAAPPQEVRDVLEAISDGRQVEFEYRNAAGEVATRTVDPFAVTSLDDLWYLIGWSHDRGAERTFRFDRMSGLVVSATLATSPRPAEGRTEVSAPESGDGVVAMLEVPSSALSLLRRYLRPDSTVEGQQTARVGIDFVSQSSLVAMVLGMAPLVTVSGPPAARDAVRAEAAAALVRYES